MKKNYNLLSCKSIKITLKYFIRTFELLWDINKLYLMLITALTLVSAFFAPISILLTQNLINSIQSDSKSLELTLMYLIVLIIANIVNVIITTYVGYFQNKFNLDISYKLKLLVLEKTRELELRDFENSDVYDSLKRAQTDLQGKPYMFFSLGLSLISQFISLVSTAIILFLWKWWFVILVLVSPIFSSLYMLKTGFSYFLIQRDRANQEREAWYNSYILTNDIAFKEMKLYGLREYFINKFNVLNKKIIEQDKKYLGIQNIGFIIFGIIDEIIGGILHVLIILSAYYGEIMIGNTVAYIRCITTVQQNVQSILRNITSMCQNNLYIKQFFDFLDIEKTHNKCEKNLMDFINVESIEFKNVSYKYDNNDNYVLKNVSFKINKGDTIAIVGENGSGKTTIVKLITGLYDNFEGDILINGVSIRKINLESYQKRVGVIFQDYNRYQMTCRENIGMGNLELMDDDLRIMDSIHKADADEVINNLHDGIDTSLGTWFNHGIELSGGQWQKIALARAFLRNADMYILDEPSSALDPLSEYEVFKKSSDLIKDKIGIFITHRLINVKKISADVLVLKNGLLIEQGTHNELVSYNSYYRHLYEIQNFNSDIYEVHKKVVNGGNE